jgi:hypothetical protein
MDMQGDRKKNCNTSLEWFGLLGAVGERGCGGGDNLEVVLDRVAEDTYGQPQGSP